MHSRKQKCLTINNSFFDYLYQILVLPANLALILDFSLIFLDFSIFEQLFGIYLWP